MTTRDQIVRTAMSFNGRCNGQGYNGAEPVQPRPEPPRGGAVR